ACAWDFADARMTIGEFAAPSCWLDSVRDERVEHLPHGLRVAAHDRGGGLDVPGGVEMLPGECVARVAGELLEQGPLGPPVALAERMDRVDLAQAVGQPCDERFPVQVTEAILAAQRAEELRRRRLDVPGQAEQAPPRARSAPRG